MNNCKSISAHTACIQAELGLHLFLPTGIVSSQDRARSCRILKHLEKSMDIYIWKLTNERIDVILIWHSVCIELDIFNT